MVMFEDITVRWLYSSTYADDAKSLRVMHFKVVALPSILIFHRLHHAAIVRSLARVSSRFLGYDGT